MSWKLHIFHVASKISKSIGIIYKASFCLSRRALRTLYHALVYPYLHYCVTVWGSTYPSNLNRLVFLQKWVTRTINKASFDAHTDPIFKELMIFKPKDIYLINLGKFIFSILNNSILRVNQVHGYNL